jgi:predicted nucleotidyltransferase
MDRERVIELLKEHDAEIRAFGVTELYLSGSVARGEAADTSDVDVLVEFDGQLRMRRHIGLVLFLEELMGRTVDVATRSMLRPEIVDSVERDLLRVA